MTNQDDLSRQNESPPGNDYLSDLISKIMASAPKSDIPQQPPEKREKEGNGDTQRTSGTPSPDLLSSLLSNPELLSKLPTILSSIKPIMDMFSSQSQSKSTASASAEPSKADESVPSGNLNLQKGHDDADRRAALLCALKPYLGHDRQNAIDYIIKLSRLGDILKSL